MQTTQRFSSVRFSNYKKLKNFSIDLRPFNILVGPNNAGKSTIIGAFRILSEGIRKARRRKPEMVKSLPGEWGYSVPLDELPVATENVFTNYDESNPAVVEFRLSDGKRLTLIFPETELCYLVCTKTDRPVESTTDFKREFPATVGLVPVLGPVEHNERLFQEEAARRALLSHRASRNFRNIWHHFPEGFEAFRELVNLTWPGMDIERPEINTSRDSPTLDMFCPEERFPRELYWAGFGFQVWCQMLTYILRSKEGALLIIDEPDIYLHSDLQRQLIGILRSLGPDILLATHSTEIVTEAEPGDLLVIRSGQKSAKRIKEPAQLQPIFEVLGSNMNPTLTQLAKTRRALFVEGKDFKILAGFARKLNARAVANRSDFAVLEAKGFNSKKVKNLSEGIELTLGTTVTTGVIFDRDFRTAAEAASTKKELLRFAKLAHIHRKKEIENYLLVPDAIDRAIRAKLQENSVRTGKNVDCEENSRDILERLCETQKDEMQSQYGSAFLKYGKRARPGKDESTLLRESLELFNKQWANLDSRLSLVPGKTILRMLNEHLQSRYKVSLTALSIVYAMRVEEVPEEIQELIDALDEFRRRSVN